VSYHQIKSCNQPGCRARDRDVVYRPLMNEYLCYPCWLEVGRERIREATRKPVRLNGQESAALRRAPDSPVPPPANDQLEMWP